MEYQGKEVRMVIKIDGDIISNDWKPAYDWYGITSTCPRDVTDLLNLAEEGEPIDVKINSGGGDVLAGQEIYTILRGRPDVNIEIESLAASAASVIAMAGHCLISPVGMVMIHNVSTYGASGNHQELEKIAHTLRKWDEALASAYVAKTGREKKEILQLMEKETWLPADRAVELGFVDGITQPAAGLTNMQLGGMQVTPDMLARYKVEKKKRDDRETEKQSILNSLMMYGV